MNLTEYFLDICSEDIGWDNVDKQIRALSVILSNKTWHVKKNLMEAYLYVSFLELRKRVGKGV